MSAPDCGLCGPLGVYEGTGTLRGVVVDYYRCRSCGRQYAVRWEPSSSA